MKHLLFLLTTAFLAGRDRLCGHALATNVEVVPPLTVLPSSVSVGIPPGLDADEIRIRKAALISAGTDPLLAEKLAIDAELQQAALDDRELRRRREEADRPIVAQVSPAGAATEAAERAADAAESAAEAASTVARAAQTVAQSAAALAAATQAPKPAANTETKTGESKEAKK